MPVLSNKSSSPIPDRANPNARNSEIGNPMRRSFTGNPFSKPSIVPNARGLNPNTPANSPADYPRRNSVGRDIEDKENLKAAKIRSPMSGSKGVKNFMSPTISAASKITPSPRKRILEERNEPVRASVSFSELKPSSFEEPVSESLVSSKPEPVFDVNSEPEAELVNLDPSFKSSPCSGPVIAPLDSDPSAPPYDPKTNYLSPRPRFLHYKPNPRVELYLNNGKGQGKRLEDSFVSGSFSDTDLTEEETTQSDDSRKESEDDVSSGEEVKAEEKEQELEDCALLSPEKETLGVKRATKSHSVWRSKLTALLIVLSIVCVSISVANLAVVDHSVFDGSSDLFKDYDHYELLTFGKAVIDGLAQKLGFWYENSVSLLSDTVLYLKGTKGIESLHYYNLTELFENVRADGIDGIDVNVFVLPTRGLEIDIGDEYEETQLSQEAEIGLYEQVFGVPEAGVVEPEDGASGVDFEEVSEIPATKSAPTENGLIGGDFEADPAPVSEAVSETQEDEPENGLVGGNFEADPAPVSEAVSETPEDEPENGLIGGDFEADPAPVSEAVSETPEAEPENRLIGGDFEADPAPVSEAVSETPVAEPENSPDGDFEIDPAPISQADSIQLPTETEASQADMSSSGAEIEPAQEADLTEDNTNASEEVNFAADGTEDSLPKLEVLGTALLVVLAAIGSVALVAAKRNGPTSNPKKPDISPEKNAGAKQQHSSWNYSGEYCPSEMSSYENNKSHYNKKGASKSGTNEEAQSYERSQKKGKRRESMASSSMDSSMGSPSYGSFTTYEKIPTKSSYGDDEIITPVRRSSRLRSQVTSPS